jgi:hypothetical protein
MKNIVYFFYFIKTTDYKELALKINMISKEINKSKLNVIMNMIRISLKFGASFKDYWMFGFYKMEDSEIDKYVTTGRLYEFYSLLNDIKYIDFFRNKKKFNETFRKYIGREYRFLDEIDNTQLKEWLSERDYIMAKPNYGVSGVGIEKISIKDWNIDDLIQYLRIKRLELLEDVIKQHPIMNALNSSSVNSIRIVTVQNDMQVDILSAVLRIGVGKHVDNFSAGGIACPIDIKTGTVYKPAVKKTEREKYEKHPITNTPIVGFKIPFWEEVKDVVREASQIVPQVRTVGWDIAISESGPVIIEGNDNWNKDAFQIPYGQGRQHILNKYLQDK